MIVDAESRSRSDGYFCQGALPQPVADAEPPHAGVSPEPGFLAAGEAPGGADGLVAGRIEGQRAVEAAEHLLVAEGAARGLAVAQAAGGQPAHLRLEAGRPHAVDAGLDPPVEFRAVHLDAYLDRGAAALVAGHRRAERATGQLDDLKRAGGAPAGGGEGGGGRGGVGAPEPLVKRRRAARAELGLQPLAYR